MYDLIIVGSGPAGLTASIYASCFHIKHIIIGKEVGGQMALAPDILNYPGYESISGKELTRHILNQVKVRGGEVISGSVISISKPKIKSSNKTQNPNDQIEDGYEVETQDGQTYQTKSIILATGTERRKLNIAGEVEYTARGVHYCATCEKFDYEGKMCAVVGGANSAVQAAVELAQAASKVYIIYRGSQLRGDPIWLKQIEENKKIEVVYNTVVKEIVGDREKVTGVKLSSTGPAARVSQFETREWSGIEIGNPSLASPVDTSLPLDKVFIEIGGVPGTALVIPLGVKMDAGGYIHVNDRLATNVAGIFAAGDLVSYGLSIEQISSAIGLGARAASSAFAYVKQEKAPSLWGGNQIKR